MQQESFPDLTITHIHIITSLCIYSGPFTRILSTCLSGVRAISTQISSLQMIWCPSQKELYRPKKARHRGLSRINSPLTRSKCALIKSDVAGCNSKLQKHIMCTVMYSSIAALMSIHISPSHNARKQPNILKIKHVNFIAQEALMQTCSKRSLCPKKNGTQYQRPHLITEPKIWSLWHHLSGRP